MLDADGQQHYTQAFELFDALINEDRTEFSFGESVNLISSMMLNEIYFLGNIYSKESLN
jgi:hypothetical protein